MRHIAHMNASRRVHIWMRETWVVDMIQRHGPLTTCFFVSHSVNESWMRICETGFIWHDSMNVKESCHTNESWHTNGWFRENRYRARQMRWVNESWHTYGWVMTHEWVMTLGRMRHIAHMNESRRVHIRTCETWSIHEFEWVMTHEWVMTLKWMSQSQ